MFLEYECDIINILHSAMSFTVSGGKGISNRNTASESKGGDPVSGLIIVSALQKTLIYLFFNWF